MFFVIDSTGNGVTIQIIHPLHVTPHKAHIERL